MNPWYRGVRRVVSWILSRYFRKILVVGTEHIPDSGPVLFTVNHQNAFLDALLVATSTNRELHFLARADVFKSDGARRFFESLNMMPIYRWRDGRAGLEANHEIFARSHKLLNAQHALLMFPEANHHQKRLLLPLSKGFTRITSGISDPDLKIVPVGLNYTHHRDYGGSVSICYGPPLPAGPQSDPKKLKTQVEWAMQQLITHIPDDEQYQWKQNQLDQDPWQYLKPSTCNHLISSWTTPNSKPKHQVSGVMHFMRWLSLVVSTVLNLPPITITKFILVKIGDPVFSSSIKVISGMLLFPLYYLAVMLLAGKFLGLPVALGFVLLAILSMIWRKYTLA